MTDATDTQDGKLFVANSFAVRVPRSELLAYGHVQATPEENAAYHADQERWWHEERATWAVYDAARAALDALEDPMTRRMLDLHSSPTVENPECAGCDYGGYDGAAPEWPCSTVRAIADHHGIRLPDRGIGTRPADVMPEPHDYPTEPWSVRDLFPMSFVDFKPILFDTPD